MKIESEVDVNLFSEWLLRAYAGAEVQVAIEIASWLEKEFNKGRLVLALNTLLIYLCDPSAEFFQSVALLQSLLESYPEISDDENKALQDLLINLPQLIHNEVAPHIAIRH